MTTVGAIDADSSSFGEPVRASSEAQMLYAFSTTKGGQPRVFTFSTSQEDIAALANLVRSEDVIMVVKGHAVRFTVESVVSMAAGELTLVDKLPLRMSELHGPTQAEQ